MTPFANEEVELKRGYWACAVDLGASLVSDLSVLGPERFLTPMVTGLWLWLAWFIFVPGSQLKAHTASSHTLTGKQTFLATQPAAVSCV